MGHTNARKNNSLSIKFEPSSNGFDTGFAHNFLECSGHLRLR